MLIHVSRRGYMRPLLPMVQSYTDMSAQSKLSNSEMY